MGRYEEMYRTEYVCPKCGAKGIVKVSSNDWGDTKEEFEGDIVECATDVLAYHIARRECSGAICCAKCGRFLGYY